jgi:hypothetical protein
MLSAGDTFEASVISVRLRAVSDFRNGRERPQKLFGRLKAEKVGSLPPVSVLYFPVLSCVAIY